MTTRRSFIKTTSMISAGILLAPKDFKLKSSLIGLQLYTVRDAMQKDAADTLSKVAKVGYNSVEGATYTGTQKFYGMDASAFSKLLKANGLVMLSSHYRLGRSNLKEKYLKVPSFMSGIRQWMTPLRLV